MESKPKFAMPIGESLPRPRARRLLEGRGQYTDDMNLPRMAHVAFLRSPYPHARIRMIDDSEGRALPGVLRVVTGKEVAKLCQPYAGIHHLFAGMRAPQQYPMAVDRACWQGEPVVAVIAETRAIAEDAVERIVVDWEPLAAVANPRDAADCPVIHPEIGSNIAYQTTVESGNTAEAFANAATIVEREFRFSRNTGVCLEPRAIIADYVAGEGTLTVFQSHQCPAQQQDLYAQILGIPEHKVRVISPDVGGAFGIKQQLYGDELAVCALSKLMRRPLKFVADRLESFASDIHARDHIVSARLAIAADGHFLGLELDDCFGIGAYSQFPRSSIGEASHVLRMSGAPYALGAYRARLKMVLQNKNMIGHYRSVGHPIAIAVTEALVDAAARELGIDPVEIRRRNYISDNAFPHVSHGGFTFEQLSQHACLERLVAMMALPQLRREQDELRRRGIYRGIGIASFVELTGTGPEYYGKGEVRVTTQEGCLVKLEPSGTFRCIPSVTDQGQGTDTAIGQIVAAVLGVRLDDVTVVSGNTESAPYGGGAWASRGASIGGEAAYSAARALRDNIVSLAAQILQERPEALAIRDGMVVDIADGRARMSLAEIARIGYFRQDLLPTGAQPELTVVRHYVPQGRPFIVTNGIQAAWVEVDIETGFTRILRHFVVHDPGTMINPMLVEEQIRGGVVQGIGAALFEEIVYGTDGALLTGTMADYLVPMAYEMPDIDIGHVSTPTMGTVLGAKGVGEAGTAGAPAAILNAVNDALAPLGANPLTELPLTPERVLRALGRIE